MANILLKRLHNKVFVLKRSINEFIRILLRGPKIKPGSVNDEILIELIGKEDPVILDIGCNDGGHTLWFLKLFKKARVYCFEPDPRARKRYLANVKDKRAMLFDIAISHTDGVTKFYMSSGTPPPTFHKPVGKLPEGWDLSGSIKKPKGHLKIHPWCKFEKKIVVKTKTLDTWVQEEGIEVIDFVWADVQGAEADLINGGKEALKKTRYFFTEYCNRELYEGQINLKQLVKLLPDFKIVHRFENDVLLRNERF